jgi:hypothetical protein
MIEEYIGNKDKDLQQQEVDNKDYQNLNKHQHLLIMEEILIIVITLIFFSFL